MGYLRQGNRDLKRTNVWVWSIPALRATLPTGEIVDTCPNAGVCATPCYARHGTYNFSNVRAAHTRNLVASMSSQWATEMISELKANKFIGAWIRIHDAGDFYSEKYALDWCEIAAATPVAMFYAYTKEVELFKRLSAESRIPKNFVLIYSLGGKQDYLVDRETDRHCEVFADSAALIAAGYHDQAEDDRLAVLGPNRVGIVANNIPHARRLAKGRAFGDWQQERNNR